MTRFQSHLCYTGNMVDKARDTEPLPTTCMGWLRRSIGWSTTGDCPMPSSMLQEQLCHGKGMAEEMVEVVD
jgi:hypothetical protein